MNIEFINKLIDCGLFWRTSSNLIEKIKNDNQLKQHLLRFCNNDIVECLKEIDKVHKIEPKITLNSLKLSYKIYQNSKKLFIPIYYRTFYGFWQKSSGACSGFIYEYDYKMIKNSLFSCEYMSFEKLGDMVKNDCDVFVRFDETFRDENMVWSEKHQHEDKGEKDDRE